jgi:dolichol kinase
LSEVTLELRRKAFHLLSLAYLAGFHFLGRRDASIVSGCFVLLVAAVELARLNSPAARGAVEAVFGPIIRKKEARRFTGAFYTSLGAFLVFAFYGSRPSVVDASLLYLALGDAASAVVGKLWGRVRYTVRGETRSLEGTAAGLAAAVLAGFLARLSPLHAAAGALAFVAADTIPIPPDDNLWIPVATGGALFALGA